MCYLTKFGRSRSNDTSITKEIRLKIMTSRVPPFEVFKVTGTDMDRSAAYDFLLTFRSNHGPISYRFRDKWRFQSKIAKKISHPSVFNVPAEGIFLGIHYRRTGPTTRMMDLPG